MRGKGLICKGSVEKKRITPAYAGKSISKIKLVPPLLDHPRLCGEKQTGDSDAVKIMGSPPPMRGKVPYNHRLTFVPRDHPRLCGEKSADLQWKMALVGSPPPMRGKGYS